MGQVSLISINVGSANKFERQKTNIQNNNSRNKTYRKLHITVEKSKLSLNSIKSSAVTKKQFASRFNIQPLKVSEIETTLLKQGVISWFISKATSSTSANKTSVMYKEYFKIPCNINETERHCNASQLSPNYESKAYIARLLRHPCNINNSNGSFGNPKGGVYWHGKIGNGIIDCHNETDEKNLKIQCTSENYLAYCKPKNEKDEVVKCIDSHYIGDGIKDCDDGWDETKEAALEICKPDIGLYPCEYEGEFESNHKKCVSIEKIGDGISDCPGGYDERISVVQKFCNTPFRRTCGNIANAKTHDIKCIPYLVIGNGVQDCFNGYDEMPSTISENCVPDTNKYYCGEPGTRPFKYVSEHAPVGLPNLKNRCKPHTNMWIATNNAVNNCLLIKDTPSGLSGNKPSLQNTTNTVTHNTAVNVKLNSMMNTTQQAYLIPPESALPNTTASAKLKVFKNTTTFPLPNTNTITVITSTNTLGYLTGRNVRNALYFTGSMVGFSMMFYLLTVTCCCFSRGAKQKRGFSRIEYAFKAPFTKLYEALFQCKKVEISTEEGSHNSSIDGWAYSRAASVETLNREGTNTPVDFEVDYPVRSSDIGSVRNSLAESVCISFSNLKVHKI